MKPRATPRPRSDFRAFRRISTRWADNDVYGHVNNVTYYGWFDTAVNGFLVEKGLLDPGTSDAIGLVVETGCSYFAPLSFPEDVDLGLVVANLGRTSVRYEIGVFAANAGETAATGHFVHVLVDRIARRPIAVPDNWRAVLETIALRA